MNYKALTLISSIALGGGIQHSAHAAVLVNDHFDDGSLTGWNMTTNNVASWSGGEAGTEFTVTDINSSVLDTGSGGAWADLHLSRSFDELSDFNVSVGFSWSASTIQAMQLFHVTLNGVDDIAVASGGHTDAWVARRGSRVAGAGESYFSSGEDAEPYSGSAVINFIRAGSDINVYYNNVLLVSGVSSTLIDSIDLRFSHYAYNNSNVSSYIGNLAVDYVQVEGTAVAIPAPAGAALLGVGLLGLGVQARRRSS